MVNELREGWSPWATSAGILLTVHHTNCVCVRVFMFSPDLLAFIHVIGLFLQFNKMDKVAFVFSSLCSHSAKHDVCINGFMVYCEQFLHTFGFGDQKVKERQNLPDCRTNTSFRTALTATFYYFFECSFSKVVPSMSEMKCASIFEFRRGRCLDKRTEPWLFIQGDCC